MNNRVISPLEARALDYIEAEAPGIWDHVLGTRDLALEINRRQELGLDEEQIALAALCHDLARLRPPEEIAEELRSRGIDPESFGYVTPMLLHCVLSAELAKEKIGVRDPAVLRAILCHATGAEEMSVLDKLIYVADKLERNREYPGVEELRELAGADLVSAFPRVIRGMLMYLVAELQPLDYNSVAAYNRALEDVEPGTAWK
jgi:predicted HD superfamily hydrolase involved in NAD metabolism